MGASGEADGRRTSVLVVAALRLPREGLATLLSTEPRIRVLGTASTEEAAALCERDAPDAVVVDVAGRTPAAIDCIARVAERTRVLAVGPVDDEPLIVACAEAGVAGYADLDGTVGDLAAAIAAAELDQLVCSPTLASTLLRQLGTLARHETPATAARLTTREMEIMGLVDEGLSNKQIAAQLHIQLATVKNHVHNVLEKLHVNGRTAAAAQTRALRSRRARDLEFRRG